MIKTVLLLLSIITASPANLAGTQSAAALIPALAQRALTEVRPGWQIARVNDDHQRDFTRSEMHLAPNVLSGDFDGNGEADFAVLVEFEFKGKRQSQVFALLHARGAFRAAAVTALLDSSPRRLLWPRRRGEKLWDLNLNREFVFNLDSIGVHSEACTTFVYEGGKFRGIWTCD